MAPLFFTLDKHLPLMVIPDTQAHLDGHAVITYTYSIFNDKGGGNPALSLLKESTLHLDHINDPDYYGYITFVEPGKLFTYTADGKRELNDNEVNELIELLSHVRDNPKLWGHLEN